MELRIDLVQLNKSELSDHDYVAIFKDIFVKENIKVSL